MRLPVYTPRLLDSETATPLRHDPSCSLCVRSSRGGHRCLQPGQRSGPGRRVLVLVSEVNDEDAAVGRIGAFGASAWLFQTLTRLFPPDTYLLLDAALRCAGGAKQRSYKEVDACRGYTASVLRSFQPEVVVACGSAAIGSMTGDRGLHERAILRGWAVSSTGKPVIAMLDHQDAFGNGLLREEMTSDLEWVAKLDPASLELETDWTYEVVTAANVDEAVAELRSWGRVSWDIEYAGVPHDGPGSYFEVLTHGLAGIGSRVVWVWGPQSVRDPACMAPLYELLEDGSIGKVAQNGKVDVGGMLAPEPLTGRDMVIPSNVVFDPLLAGHLQDSNVHADLATLAYRVGRGRTKGVLEQQHETAAEWIRHVRRQATTADLLPDVMHPAYVSAVKYPKRSYMAFANALVDPALLVEYQATDVATTATLARKMIADVESDPVTRAGWKILQPLSEVVARMEASGMAIDMRRLDAFETHLRVEGHRLGNELLLATNGRHINVNADADVADYVYNTLRLPVVEVTKTGQPSVKAEVLETLAKDHPHPALPLILQLKEVEGTYLSRYAVGMRAHVRGDGRVHPSFNLDGARTGRWSSSDPNFQNLAEHSKLAKWVKRYLVAKPGYVILSYDYRQIEYLMASVVSGDPTMQQIFIDGHDIHRRTAELIGPVYWKIATEVMAAMSKDEMAPYRQQAKAVNFGALFNMQVKTLAMQLGCTEQEAALLLKAILTDLFPGFTAWRDRAIHDAVHTGRSYVYDVQEDGTLLPVRCRKLLDVASNNKKLVARAINGSVNTPVQGSATILQVKAIAKIDKWLMTQRYWQRGLCRIVNAVHDATYLECHKSLVPEVHANIVPIMTDWPMRGVPIRVDGKVGEDLASMISIEDWLGKHAA